MTADSAAGAWQADSDWLWSEALARRRKEIDIKDRRVSSAPLLYVGLLVLFLPEGPWS